MLAKLYHCEKDATALFWILQNAFQISFSGVCDLEYYNHFAMFIICLRRKLHGMATKSTQLAQFSLKNEAGFSPLFVDIQYIIHMIT